MNTQSRAVETVDRNTGEITELPAGYSAGNQSLAVQLAIAELNQDVTTAKAFPRSVAKVMRNVTELVMLDEQTAKECVYAVPRDGKTIRGPSIRLAEIIASQWGNCHCASRIVHVDKIEKYVESEGIFHDLETGLKRTARTRKNISKRDGSLYSQDMIMTAGNAAASIGMREAILKGVPKAVWRQAFDHAENVIRGDITTLVERREDAMKALAGIGVTPDRIFAAIGVAGLDEIGVEELADLFAMYQGIKSKETDVDEVFPPVKKGGGDQPSSLKGKLDQLAGDDAGKDKDKKSAEEKKPAGTKSDAGTPAASEKPGEKGTKAGQAPSSGKSPPTQAQPDDGDPIAVATRLGRAAYRKNMSERAVPVDFKQAGREAERDAWIAGFRDEADKDSPEPGATEEDER
ncbi:hypothetical protein EN742_00775 [Mesorhizobium sp. M4A.F.Ca.ET.020.02.1.1]|uniref:hypothetical protein n=1 Tax=Mesorhizobium sp. M4A.F.Ca.ET.020.02.1.1 TaxID=2496652 RepID=UPI000FD5A84F|nr:hypothetical protein [Mesorhizobium sp. M4A.F.Ca.ET.020.02.1.1]RVD44912.1 hypothetical protein EN742_00775 [Mesorhizobium sp. M4A.F.Ca.ET.020.02.1.1]